MSDPVATYGAKVLAKGYRMYGDTRTGLKATVPYLVGWHDAYNFINAIINPINVVRVGLISYRLPYRLPAAVAATPIYAQAFEITPCGVDPDLDPLVPLTYRGLAAGEFFSHAIVTVQFEQLAFSFDPLTEDPYGLQQLDPDNPIPFCEQSVKIGGKMVTRKGLMYRYVDTGKPVVGDVGVLVPEAKLVLRFPHVPYLPWQLLVPYVGKVNAGPILLCAAETLILESPDTQAKASLNSPYPVESAVTLEFAYDPNGWNKLPHPDGTLAGVVKTGDSLTGIYATADFGEIFDALAFTQESG